ncbi:MAG: type II toxin-antitoxin system RelE/ParE family toxin [Geminicoccaceae bacterium]
MIKAFADRDTEAVFTRRVARGLPAEIQRTARRKLMQLDRAQDLRDLRAPPGNRLEALKGDRAGQYSIRVNDQWRICFVWRDSDAYEVEIVDYHS